MEEARRRTRKALEGVWEAFALPSPSPGVEKALLGGTHITVWYSGGQGKPEPHVWPQGAVLTAASGGSKTPAPPGRGDASVEVNMGQRHQNTTTGSRTQEDQVVLQMDLTREEVEALHALLTGAERRGELPEALHGVLRGLKWARAYERWRKEGGEWPFNPDWGLREDS